QKEAEKTDEKSEAWCGHTHPSAGAFFELRIFVGLLPDELERDVQRGRRARGGESPGLHLALDALGDDGMVPGRRRARHGPVGRDVGGDGDVDARLLIGAATLPARPFHSGAVSCDHPLDAGGIETAAGGTWTRVWADVRTAC